MLFVARNLRDISFSQLMEVYIEGNLEKGNLLEAEQDFYQYLKEGFFTREGDSYCIWAPEGRYVAACRVQVYWDGILLEAVETAPQLRRRGYARAMLRAVLQQHPGKKFYVHIAPWNTPSIGLHEGCGFRKISDTAVYADGSFTCNAGTYVYE